MLLFCVCILEPITNIKDMVFSNGPWLSMPWYLDLHQNIVFEMVSKSFYTCIHLLNISLAISDGNPSSDSTEAMFLAIKFSDKHRNVTGSLVDIAIVFRHPVFLIKNAIPL